MAYSDIGSRLIMESGRIANQNKRNPKLKLSGIELRLNRFIYETTHISILNIFHKDRMATIYKNLFHREVSCIGCGGEVEMALAELRIYWEKNIIIHKDWDSNMIEITVEMDNRRYWRKNPEFKGY